MPYPTVKGRHHEETHHQPLLCCCVWSLASDDDSDYSNSPSAWRIENDASDAVVRWFTNSTCSSGQVMFGAGATKADLNRFWATVTSAKVTVAKMFLYYDNSNAPASCPAVSFGLEAFMSSTFATACGSRLTPILQQPSAARIDRSRRRSVHRVRRGGSA